MHLTCLFYVQWSCRLEGYRKRKRQLMSKNNPVAFLKTFFLATLSLCWPGAADSPQK